MITSGLLPKIMLNRSTIQMSIDRKFHLMSYLMNNYYYWFFSSLEASSKIKREIFF